MEGDDVGCAQERLVVDRLDPEFGEAVGGEVRVVGDHAHLEGEQALRHPRPDATEADDADRAGAQVGRLDLLSFPAPGMGRSIGLGQLAGDCEEERDGVLGRRCCVGPGCV